MIGYKKRGESKIMAVALLIALVMLTISGAAINASNEDKNETNTAAGTTLSHLENPSISTKVQASIKVGKQTLSVKIKDSDETTLDASLEIRKKPIASSGISGLAVAEPSMQKYEVDLKLNEGPIEKITFHDTILEDTIDVGVDDVPEFIPGIGKPWQEVYAIDPARMNFSTATVKVTAKGTKLYKCAKWDFETQQCKGNWSFLQDTIPGKSYIVTLTPDDPAFGEILAVDAIHLSENFTPIQNIFQQVNATDDIWSPPIYPGQIVEVLFENPLENGNVIDVKVRKNGTDLFFDVFEAESMTKVARSGIIFKPELQFMHVRDLQTPSDRFYFIVREIQHSQKDENDCKENCYESCPGEYYGECIAQCDAECTVSQSNLSSFIEFDLIHDEAINKTQANGILGYQESNVQRPQYVEWNASNAFTVEQTDAQAVSSDITWVVTRGNHEHDQMIMGTLNKNNEIDVQIYNSSKAWGDALTVTSNTENSAYRSFDIAVEQLSGDTLIVYENGSDNNADSDLAYRIWNGTAYGAEQRLPTSSELSEYRWVTLVPKQGSDLIMLVAHNDLSDLYAVLWNGTAFETTNEFIPSADTTSITEEHFAFAWEESSTQGLLWYGESDLTYRTYDRVGGFGGVENTISTGAIDGIRLCSDPTSDHIGIIWQDSGPDLNARMWDGTQILASPPSEDASVQNAGSNNLNIDCAWDNNGTQALFGFIDTNQASVDYFTFEKSNTWSTSDLTSTSNTGDFATSTIRGMEFTKHPTTEEILIIAADTSRDISAIRWDGAAMQTIAGNPLEGNTEVQNAAQGGVMFDWYRFDPPPQMINRTPTGLNNLETRDSVNISVNVTDNINVSSVFANITDPFGTVTRLQLLDENLNNLYNATYPTSIKSGIYTVLILVNDTSIFKNENSSTFTFTIVDSTTPNVTNATPTLNSSFNVSDVIEIGVNASASTNVDTVTANITIPNGTIQQLTLTNATEYKARFNASYTIPTIIGNYNITFIVNNSNSNQNASVTANFSVADVLAPSVRNITPSNNSVQNIAAKIEIGANVSDQVFVRAVTANVSHPNSTVEQFVLANATLHKTRFNFTYTVPIALGSYNISFFANDSSGNINNTEVLFFNISDLNAPSVRIVLPANKSNFFENDNVSLSVNITDQINLSNITANVTLPNSAVVILNLSDQDQDGLYNATIRNTSQLGSYTVRIIANDSSGNVNASTSIVFTTQDPSTPLVNLLNPADSSQQTLGNVNFTCNATDSSGLANITIHHNISQSFGKNVTVNVTGTKNRTSVILTDTPDGAYLWNCQVYDTNGNPSFAAANFSFTLDNRTPNVVVLYPALNTPISQPQTINIGVNITDFSNIALATANISFPNGNVSILNLTNSSTSPTIFNTTFTLPPLLGSYNVTFFANDTNGHRNGSVTTNFTVRDTSTPSLTALNCTPSTINLTQYTVCNATVTDNIQVKTVKANVTLSNGTILEQTVLNVSSNFYFNFTQTSKNVGQFNITWTANDSSNNVNFTNASLYVNDSTKPSIILNGPVATFNTSSSITTNFTVVDNFFSILNCSLYINGTLNQTNATTNNGTPTVFIASPVHGQYTWNISCSDNSSNVNTSLSRSFTVDKQAPTFVSLTSSPATEAELDPNILINVTGNVTDNTTVVNTIIFQYRLSSIVNFTNVTMTYNGSSQLGNASFNATNNGTYILRMIANDTLGNLATSNTINITVQTDRTWVRKPSSFPAVSGNVNTNISLGNITINNTGDVALNFTITSSSETTLFNYTTTFALAAKNITTIAVNDSGNATGNKLFTINITAATNANPSLQQIPATMVIGGAQPILRATITDPSADTLTITQGDTNIDFVGKIENIGTGNATNVTGFFNLPETWEITFGEINQSEETLNSGDELDVSLQVTIPSNETPATINITFNSTGFNSTGGDLSLSQLIFGDVVEVTIEGTSQGLGGTQLTDEESSESSGSPGSSVSSGGSSGGGSSGGSVSRSSIGRGTTLYTEELVILKRGQTEKVALVITNLYKNALLKNISLEVQGFLSQYVSITPIIDPNARIRAETLHYRIKKHHRPSRVSFADFEEHTLDVTSFSKDEVNLTFRSEPQNLTLKVNETQHIYLENDTTPTFAVELLAIKNHTALIDVHRYGPPDPGKLVFGEERSYDISIFAPGYLTEQDYNITVKIDSRIVAIDPKAAGFIWKTLTEYRTFVFKVASVDQSEAMSLHEEANTLHSQFLAQQFPLNRISKAFQAANTSFFNKKYSALQIAVEDMRLMHARAFEAHGLMNDVQTAITKAESRWLEVPESKRMHALAQKAFNREDFSGAFQRAKEAQLSILIETKGRINLAWFVGTYWWAIVMSLFSLYWFARIASKLIQRATIAQRIRNLHKEEETLHQKMEDAQRQYAVESSISPGDFHTSMAQYEKRLAKIIKTMSKLKHIRIKLFSIDREKKNLQKEEQDLKKIAATLQDLYFNQSKLSRSAFQGKYASVKERLADIEREKALFAERARMHRAVHKSRKKIWRWNGQKKKTATTKGKEKRTNAEQRREKKKRKEKKDRRRKETRELRRQQAERRAQVRKREREGKIKKREQEKKRKAAIERKRAMTHIAKMRKREALRSSRLKQRERERLKRLKRREEMRKANIKERAAKMLEKLQ